MARTPKKTKARVRQPSGDRRPLRRCAVSRVVSPKDELLRLVLDPAGRVALDVRGQAPGRGVYVAPEARALADATSPKGLGRLFRGRARGLGFSLDPGPGSDGAPALHDLVSERVLELLALARRAGRVVVGHDAVADRLRRPARGGTLLLAADLSPNARERILAAGERGKAHARVRVFGRKVAIGARLGRGTTGIVWIEPGTMADRVAAAARRAAELEAASPDERRMAVFELGAIPSEPAADAALLPEGAAALDEAPCEDEERATRGPRTRVRAPRRPSADPLEARESGAATTARDSAARGTGTDG